MHEHICCAASCELDEKRATKPKFVAQSRPALYFSQQLFFNPQQMFLLRDKLIVQGEKRETSTQTCNETMLRTKFRVFCISYFAAFNHWTTTSLTARMSFLLNVHNFVFRECHCKRVLRSAKNQAYAVKNVRYQTSRES